MVQYGYTDSEWKDMLTSYNGNVIVYDDIGNPMNYYNGTTFEWSNGRSLIRATKADGTYMSYRYNDDGIRIRKSVNGTATDFFLNGSDVIAQKTGNNIIWFNYDASGQRVSFEYGNQNYYYVYNAQGDVIGLMNGSLELVVQYKYDSWGKLISISGELADTVGVINPFRYRGYYYDTETGLYYLNSRYYDPEVGRFINADMQLIIGGDVLGVNLFAYCGNNPIKRSDSTGRWFGLDDLFAAGVGALAGLASQFTSDMVESVSSGSWKFSSWQTYVGAGVGGAVGGVTTLYSGPVTGTVVGSVTSTLVGQTLENFTGGEQRSGTEIVANAVSDATTSALLNKAIPIKIPKVTIGRNSMSSVYNSGLTKIKNKTASKMSLKVVMKGVVSSYTSDLGVSIGMGYKSYIIESITANKRQTKTFQSEIPHYWCAP